MTKSKRPIVKPSRVKAEMPDLYVKTSAGWPETYAKANIRVKSGKYLYLFWRDGDTVKNFYLGKKRNS